MSKKLWMHLTFVLTLVCATSVVALAQEKSLSCDDNWNNGDRVGHCLMREQTIAATGAVTVDGKKNGGVSIKGWDRREVLVRAKVQTWANTKADAQAVAAQIFVATDGANIHAEGPADAREQGWAVSYEVFVPRNTNLSLKTHNGGINVSNVRGQIEFDALNGGVNLKQLAGHVKGTTKNGGLNIELDGSRWDGEGMDVTTTNGGVNLKVPENYSARLETSTVNGGMKFDIPITVQGEIKREISTDLGGGGPTIRVRTTNGGVNIKRKA
ncbi:MAG: DUF4097 family beta strand repeat-containing protein [Acidobacteriota bacterium]